MLIQNEACILISSKYADFADVFSPNLVAKLLKYIEINNNPVNLVEGQYPPYGPIYSLEWVKIENLKTYIKTN